MSSFFEKAKEHLVFPYNVWPKYIYHFAGLDNTISILKNGYICSRNYLEHNNIEFSSNTSKSVLSNTKEYVKDYVRFYFRPKTPTQYQVEGLRPNFVKELNIPFLCFLCFDLKILEQYKDKCFVSDKSLALKEATIQPLSQLDNFNYTYIYHDGWYDTNKDSYIKKYKNAEIVFKDFIDLSNLSMIVVRSSADKETLTNLLHDENIYYYDDKIIYDNQYSYIFYENKYFYVYDVEKTNRYVKFIVHNLTNYVIRCYIQYDDEEKYEVPLSKNFFIMLRENYSMYKVELIVNDELMYYGKYHKTIENDIF